MTHSQLSPDEILELMALLDAGQNLFGSLSPQIRQRLAAVADNPSQITWDDAYSIVLTDPGGRTLWQALLAHTDYQVASRNSESTWPSYPTTEQILRALRAELAD